MRTYIEHQTTIGSFMPLCVIAAHLMPPPHPPDLPAPAPAKNRRGNPNLALAPRCGAHTRSGCPCRAPSIRGKLRCRMHGGRSTGPRTPEGLARVRAARTIHGRYSAQARAHERHVLAVFRRGQVLLAAVRCGDRLPPDLADRLNRVPPVLMPPPFASGGLSRSQDRALLRAEAEALGPWKLAIAMAKSQGRRNTITLPEPHAPVTAPSSGCHHRLEAGTTRPKSAAPRRRVPDGHTKPKAIGGIREVRPTPQLFLSLRPWRTPGDAISIPLCTPMGMTASLCSYTEPSRCDLPRHSRASGNPGQRHVTMKGWVPACAGMTKVLPHMSTPPHARQCDFSFIQDGSAAAGRRKLAMTGRPTLAAITRLP
jgi:hypothetical protein